MERRAGIGWVAAVAAGLAACGRPAAPAPTPNEVVARHVAGDLPKADPAAGAWDLAPEHVATLLLQDQAEPKLTQPGVATVRVRALTDGAWIAFRLQWDDPTKDDLVGPNRFGDAVALQVPLEGGGEVPDGAMGQAGRPVRIHAWKAALQEAGPGKPDAVARLHPNNPHPDHYPYEAGPTEADRAQMEKRYAPARAAGNPWASPREDGVPVQDLVAEGYGSLSPAPAQVSAGRGVHDGKGWTVVVSRPLDSRPGEALRPAGRTYAAYAVWEGSQGNAGARKMRTGWIPLSIEGGK